MIKAKPWLRDNRRPGYLPIRDPTLVDPYAMYYAELGQPSDELFGMALST